MSQRQMNTHGQAVVSKPEDDVQQLMAAPPAAEMCAQPDSAGDVAGGYAAVRFNAMKHGILSRSVVLPHEDSGEFNALMAALMEEHRPGGATERHLVEELAAIMWRKRRVLLAEGAAINRGLRSVASDRRDSPIAPSAPFEPGLSGEDVDLAELMTATPEEVADRLRDAESDLAGTRNAAAILRRGGKRAYERARRALIPESRDWWDEHVEAQEYPPTPEGLGQFIRTTLEPTCVRLLQEARLQPAIKTQTLGEGLQPGRLLALNRYETHLDRKFERTLAMIVKLKDIRRSRASHSSES